MPAISPAVSTALDNVIARAQLRDPALDVTGWRQGLVDLLEGWDGSTSTGRWGSDPMSTAKATGLCDWFASIGVPTVRVNALRTWFGV